MDALVMLGLLVLFLLVGSVFDIWRKLRKHEEEIHQLHLDVIGKARYEDFFRVQRSIYALSDALGYAETYHKPTDEYVTFAKKGGPERGK